MITDAMIDRFDESLESLNKERAHIYCCLALCGIRELIDHFFGDHADLILLREKLQDGFSASGSSSDLDSLRENLLSSEEMEAVTPETIEGFIRVELVTVSLNVISVLNSPFDGRKLQGVSMSLNRIAELLDQLKKEQLGKKPSARFHEMANADFAWQAGLVDSLSATPSNELVEFKFSPCPFTKT